VTGHRHALALVVCLPLAIAACASQPRQRPVKTTPIPTQPGSLDADRKRLLGRWTLVGLTVAADDVLVVPVEAAGILTFDAFANLQIEYRLTEAGRTTLEGLGIKTPGLVLSTSGNAAIDPTQHQITYMAEDAQQKAMGFDPDLAARRANPFTVDRVRHYTFGDDNTLTLTTRRDDGRDAAVARWKRSS